MLSFYLYWILCIFLCANDKVVIAQSLVEYWQISYSFLIFCWYFVKYEKLVKYLSNYNKHCVIINSMYCIMLGKISMLKFQISIFNGAICKIKVVRLIMITLSQYLHISDLSEQVVKSSSVFKSCLSSSEESAQTR